MVVVYLNARIALCSFACRYANESINCFFRHRWMGSESYQIIQFCYASSQLLVEQAEQERDWRGACSIRDDDEDALSIQWQWVAGLRNELLHILNRQSFCC